MAITATSMLASSAIPAGQPGSLLLNPAAGAAQGPASLGALASVFNFPAPDTSMVDSMMGGMAAKVQGATGAVNTISLWAGNKAMIAGVDSHPPASGCDAGFGKVLGSINTVKAKADAVLGSVRSTISTAIGSINGLGQSLMQKASSIAGSTLSSVADVLTWMAGASASAISGLRTAMAPIVATLGSALNTIKSAATEAAAALTGMATEVMTMMSEEASHLAAIIAENIGFSSLRALGMDNPCVAMMKANVLNPATSDPTILGQISKAG